MLNASFIDEPFNGLFDTINVFDGCLHVKIVYFVSGSNPFFEFLDFWFFVILFFELLCVVMMLFFLMVSLLFFEMLIRYYFFWST